MHKKRISLIILSLLITILGLLSGCNNNENVKSEKVVLRVANCEEYIDLGDWDEDELIELEDGTEIIGVNSLVEDFEAWYEETYGIPVEVQYSTYGTNEDLYNQITIGDVYDLVCPSEYMIMKMMREGMLQPYSEEFWNPELENNYYIKGVSPYIKNILADFEIDGEKVGPYAAGYMWGSLGIVYNPEYISDEEASHYNILWNRDYNRNVTIKDSVRDSYFAAIATYYYDEITSEDFINDPNYQENLSEILNRTDEETIKGVEALLSDVKDNVYSFETDSGKADLVSGKVYANLQWSGDGVYTIDQAEEDGVELCYACPTEGCNVWFDGWSMLKKGIDEDTRKQHAAEAFVNFISMPENVIRNMYYIGYTSCITGGDSDMIFQYIDWCYGAEEDEEETVEYNNIGYLFTEDPVSAEEDYIIETTPDQLTRQLFAQYPPKEVTDSGVVMRCFDDEANKAVNRSWVNVRCFDLKSLFK